MRLYLFLIPLLLVGIQLSAQDTCKPSLTSIFDFEPGDWFEYLVTSSNGVDGGFFELTKTSILTRTTNGDTIRYTTSGTYFKTAALSDTIYFTPFNNKYYDTIVIVEDSSNSLNPCRDSLLKFHTKGSFVYNGDVFASLDTITFQNIFGLHLGETLLDDSLRYVFIEYEEIYGEGIGIMYKRWASFESTEEIKLLSYFKDGVFNRLFVGQDEIQYHHISVSPNPVRSYTTIISNNYPIDNVEIYSLIGKQVSVPRRNESSHRIIFDFNSLPAGQYFIKVVSNNLVETIPIIKVN